ncbi:2-dehydro-3-deoxygluconokinase [Hymenobacter amundsenii]|uniref:2-dehydro-3-deoxygluconokinase n=1 Tax=Hymenobacter amundsenii TaxID=2006685 RepID=A0A246FLR3_9BACT|nr:sugar kinase [Hymenobacter amundsenii]OWP63678.1 2-dehydro-3-deoxygluconokinase [Hymenobacter amundsenii]
MKQVVTFGEIMLRLSPPLHQRLSQAGSLDVTYGGGEANVAAALVHLGLPAAHVGCFPDNAVGEAAVQHFRSHGVDMSHCVFRGQRLGLYFLEVGAALRASRIVYDRYESAFAHLQPEWFAWDQILQNAQWLHWTGITPAVSASAAEAARQAIAAARRLGLTVSADVNYRRNLWQYGQRAQDVMPALVAGCDLVVCTEGDAEDLFGIRPEEGAENSFVSMSEQLMQRFPTIKQVIATRRQTQSASHERIKGIAYAEGRYHETDFFDINPVVDRIGGGDSFLSGFIYAQLSGRPLPDALGFATAASALKHTIAGDINLVSAAEVDHILAGNTFGRLLR